MAIDDDTPAENAARERRKELLRDYTIAGPPKLKLRLGSRIKVLLIANIIPLGALAWIGWRWSQGGVAINPAISTPALVVTLGVLLGACIILVLTGWVVLPLARWLRDYPTWHFKRRSQVLWLLPTVGGWSVWLACWLLGLATMVVCLAGIVVGLSRLFFQAQEVQATAIIW